MKRRTSPTRRAPRRIALWATTLSALCSLAFVLAAGDSSAGAQSTIEMKIATVAPEGTPWEKQLRSFRRYVQENTNGRVQVKMFMGGSLGGEKALVRRTAQGSIQVFGGSTAALGSLVPELNVIEAPYLFDDAQEADRALDNDAVRSQVASLVSARGFQMGFWAENGFRSWFTKDRAIRQPSDLQGLRMRSQEARIHLATYRSLGANPVPIDVTNVLTSLQTNVVDGFDNTPLFAFATSWYQAARHLNLSEHSYQPGIIVYSKRWFDGLPDDIKQVLTNVPGDMERSGRRNVRRMDPILVRNLERYGIQVHRPSASERQAFAQATSSVANRTASKIGSGARNLLRAIRAAN
ncbi:MAG TPA: TRAP transporter substrate-binding protein DctP [Polyangiaceae bacterium LLY-WYZ-15_(1-7)]|nr:TRAP transporter substrate-binding protein DctP [Polyangiaceae bacterium LLY-WYZ-15_(1-7)]HJL09575.1 TRAP transporter substrate-binding protein DctP [Polyangiaceae bacterium LLY-WYZ-15_(1-7)]HJL24309.1 TRAP transporter substrate-binding protein DctP [Polyangiaceae bacterium LLY-WYZ-15_(1-7)]HJL27633.1 TRAP transporter substrate-binding protein DctP [Polyangiaceae bacterium LLY-WYZ-15_(1-7)]HJL46631.1 TRAP transporter substrate-binding protein DctP [Polyangiaceae bacterium LLY-WYZ-15_(1-7)]